MRKPPHPRPSPFSACSLALLTAAWLAACDEPLTTPPEPASPLVSQQSATASDGQTGICDRTWQVREEIMDRAGKDDCAEVTDDDLAGIWYLNLAWYGFDTDGESSEECEDEDSREPDPGFDGVWKRSGFGPGKTACASFPFSRMSASAGSDTTRITALKEGDLNGLTGLGYLTLEGQGLSTLPEGIFADLGNLTDLSLSLNLFRTLGEDVFESLESLEELDLSGNLLVRLPEGIFDGLDALEELHLSLNNLHTLPEGIFDGLDALEELHLLLNNLHTLPAGVFHGLENLDLLDLRANRLTALPENVFEGLDNLSELLLDYNRITELAAGVFSGLENLLVLWIDYNGLAKLHENLFEDLGELEELTLAGNDLTELPENVFEGLDNLSGLLLDYNRITELKAGVFSGLENLLVLWINYNGLAELHENLFEDLGELEELRLAGNDLTEIPEDVFDGLDDLVFLDLSYNRLETLPVDVFDGLDNLRLLHLGDNQLAELPADIFQGLDDLIILDLSHNRLGSLPGGVFGDLDDLERVGLRGNQLLELPTGLFAGLDGLETVWLHENPGAPFRFHLELTRTDNTNQQAAPPATVEVRVAEGAPFEVEIRLVSRGGSLDDSEVTISVGDTASRSVTASAEASAAHSLAIDSIWDDRSWFDHDNYQGFEFVVGAPLVLANPEEVTVEVPAVYLTQGAQSLDGGVPLVAGRQALLRVFATADVDGDFEPSARATFYFDDDSVQVDLEPPTPMPRAVDESRLDGSFTGVVPAAAMQFGVEMVVELDPTDVIPEADGSQLRIPASGRMALDVVELDTLDLKIVPIAFGSDASGRNDKVASLAADMAGDDSRNALRPTRTLLPVSEMSVTVRERYVTWADTLQDGILALLNELQVLRHAEAGDTDTYYHGVFASPATRYPEYWSGVLGVAYIGGWSGLSLSHDGSGQYSSGFPVTLAHELGHNLGLRHAPCGYPEDVDPRYPYFDGNIGVWGYAFGTADGDAGRLLNPEGHYDLMSYCGPEGVSDFNFTMALDYRDAIGSAAMARRPAATRETLLLWGSIREGELRLEPVFEWTAPVKLPESPGPYRLEGVDATGRSLFQLSFSPDETGDGDMGFLFALEAEDDWATTLATVTLTGPEGSFVVDGSRRGAIVTDRATGRVVSIARDWDGVLGRDGALPSVLGYHGDVDIHRSLPRPR